MREKFFAPILKKIIYLESGQLTYTENNNFLKFLRREYNVRIPGLKDQCDEDSNTENFFKNSAKWMLIYDFIVKVKSISSFLTFCKKSAKKICSQWGLNLGIKNKGDMLTH